MSADPVCSPASDYGFDRHAWDVPHNLWVGSAKVEIDYASYFRKHPG